MRFVELALIGACTGGCLALADASLSLLAGRSALRSADALTASVAATALAVMAVYAAACLATVPLLRRRGRDESAVRRIVLALTLGPALSALQDTMRLMLIVGLSGRGILLMSACIALPLAAERLWRRWRATGWQAAPAVQLWAALLGVTFLAWAHTWSFMGMALACAASALLFALVRRASRGEWLKAQASWIIATLALTLLVSPVLGRAPRLFVPRTSVACDAGPPRIRPVILLTVDTLRWDALGCSNVISAGSADPTAAGPSLTPHLDALAGDSIVFAQARASAPWTLPSFASIHTGVSPEVHGAVRPESRTPSALRTLAERMKEAGYATAAFGANPFLRPQANLDQGFDTYEFYPRPGVSFVGGAILAGIGVRGFRTDVTSGDVTDLAHQWLTSHAHGPVFLWVHYFDPHAPYVLPAEFAVPPPPGVDVDPGLEYADDIRAGRFMPTAAQRRHLRRLYEAEVRLVDHQIGRLVAALRAAGVYEESLIVMTSDHGEEFWDHEGFEHGHSLYDELIHVPLLVKLPGGQAQERRAIDPRGILTPVSLESLAPTILDVCGVSFEPADFTADSLRSMWQATDERRWTGPVVSTGLLYYENRDAVVFDGFKFIRTRVGAREQVFQLTTDPAERRDISAERSDLAERGRKLLGDHLQQARRFRERLGVLAPETIQIDADTRRRLRSLGYIE